MFGAARALCCAMPEADDEDSGTNGFNGRGTMFKNHDTNLITKRKSVNSFRLL
jgi:hypothetical protein